MLVRFWDKVAIGDGCWEWKGALFTAGYGAFKYQGHKIGAHRMAFRLRFGKFDDKLFVCHRCDNRRCVRPSHLFLGTCKDNHDEWKSPRLYVDGSSWLWEYAVTMWDKEEEE